MEYRFLALSTLLVTAGCATAQNLTSPSHTFEMMFGKGAKILGSGEIRDGFGLAYSYGKREPRFSIGRIRAQLVYEGYADYTSTDGETRPRESTYALGGLAYGRWWLRPFHYGPEIYADLGVGLQMATRPTHDLPSDLNSTPMFDIGAAVPAGRVQVLFGIRYLHISNAGTDQPNRGQNEFFLTAGVRW